MKRGLAVLQLLGGLGWGLAMLFLAVMFGMTAIPKLTGLFLLYCVAFFAGPVLLIAGSIMTMFDLRSKAASIMGVVGAILFTGFVLYVVVDSAVVGDFYKRAPGSGVDRALILTVSCFLIFALATDWASFKIFRIVSSQTPKGQPPH